MLINRKALPWEKKKKKAKFHKDQNDYTFDFSEAYDANTADENHYVVSELKTGQIELHLHFSPNKCPRCM